jgi:hypothetical protein
MGEHIRSQLSCNEHGCCRRPNRVEALQERIRRLDGSKDYGRTVLPFGIAEFIDLPAPHVADASWPAVPTVP